LARATWRWRCQPALLVLFWGTILYVTFLPGPIGDIRFRVPVVPWLLVLMAAGFCRPSLPRARSGAPMAGDKAKAA
jgi:hypothetical protein